MKQFPSEQDKTFLKMVLEFEVNPTDTFDIKEQDDKTLNSSLKIFKMQLRALKIAIDQFDPSSDAFYRSIFIWFEDFLKEEYKNTQEMSISTHLVTHFLSSFINILVLTLPDIIILQTILNVVEPLIKKYPNSTFVHKFEKISVICHILLFQNSSIFIIDSRNELIDLPEQASSCLYKYFLNNPSCSLNLVQAIVFPNFNTSDYENIEQISSEIIFQPSLYALLLENSQNINDILFVKIFSIIRQIIHNILNSQDIDLETIVFLSKFLSSGDVFRGCFCHYLLLLLSIRKFWKYGTNFLYKLRCKTGASIIKQILIYNTTLEFYSLVSEKGAFISQEVYSLRDYYDSETLLALRAFSEWKELDLSLISRKYEDPEINQRLFTTICVLLKLKSLELLNFAQIILNSSDEFYQSLIELINLSKNTQARMNPMTISLISGCFLLFYGILSGITNDKKYDIFRNILFEFSMNAINFVFSANITPDRFAIQDALLRQLNAGVAFMNNEGMKLSIRYSSDPNLAIVRAYLIHKLNFQPCSIMVGVFCDIIKRENIISYTIACKLMESMCINDPGNMIFSAFLDYMTDLVHELESGGDYDIVSRMAIRFLIAFAVGLRNVTFEKISDSNLFEIVVGILNEFVEKTTYNQIEFITASIMLLLALSEKKKQMLIDENIFCYYLIRIAEIPSLLADLILDFEMLYWSIPDTRPHSFDWNSVFCSKSSKIKVFVETYNKRFNGSIDSAAAIEYPDERIMSDVFWKQVPREFVLLHNSIMAQKVMIRSNK
ncbi:hypothetical protein TVAG_255270 [Trichomonas vaginalis G3]|uniref:Uncharacterized protein n=1 Tax=Trichomonas vaginalis (strain ATCC PRA-98 / G3) TaxID=412133 RepID=A2FPY7_TRIV3|nr:hypothetical protein TVAGG3_0089230 [Trichomonas vaginalis G3]EAX93046.1 hypothetical protein TVAG_255270 [Trichomonas vaginalis G3]KAI5543791.1 hypothetical protein TVAGG3_0089230 [Trichomonas vaginalis G3]|eukprot:XP_001305976.1 hypothetical protein [Trichomonas vaginalis G3]